MGMGLIRRPFGIDERDFQSELDRCRKGHEAKLAGLQTRVNELRSHNTDLHLRLTQAQQAVRDLEAKQDEFASPAQPSGMNQPWLTAMAQGCWDHADLEAQEVARLQYHLERYRDLRNQVAAGVLSFLHPFLQARPISVGPQKGGAA